MNAMQHIEKFIDWLFFDWRQYKWISLVVSFLGSFFLSISVPLFGLAVLILIDMRFGLKKYIKRQGGDPNDTRNLFYFLRSGGIRRTLSKAGDYMFIIISVSVFEWVLQHLGINLTLENIRLTNIIIFLLCSVELKSIDENIQEIRGLSIVSRLIDLIYKKLGLEDITPRKKQE